MKIIHSVAIFSAMYVALASADKGFNPKNATKTGATAGNAGAAGASNKLAKIETAANFGKTGAKIDVCPSGDCTNGQAITLALSRLEEYSADDKLVVMASNFNTVDGDWSEFAETTVGGVAVMSTSYTATLSVKDKSTVIDTPAFNLTASIFAANGTTMNGNQTVPVPAGGLKFTVALASWLFQATTNKLRFALTMRAKGNGTSATASAMPPPEKKKRNGTEPKIDRLDFGEGMFMDAPALAVLDGTDTDVSASVVTAGANVEYVWVFPSFKKTLYYDPVVGSTDASAQVTTDTSATAGVITTTTTTTTPSSTTAAPTPTPTPTTTTKSAASSACLTLSALLTGAAAVATYTCII